MSENVVKGGFSIPITRDWVEWYGEFIDRDLFTGRDRMAPGERAALFLRFGLPREVGSYAFNPADLTEDIGLVKGHYDGDFPDCADYDHNHCCRTCGLRVEVDQ